MSALNNQMGQQIRWPSGLIAVCYDTVLHLALDVVGVKYLRKRGRELDSPLSQRVII